MTRALALCALLALSACQTTNATMPDPGSRTAAPVEQPAPKPRIDPAGMTCTQIREAMEDRANVMAKANEDTYSASAAKVMAGQIPFVGGAVSAGLNGPWYAYRGAAIDFARLATAALFRGCSSTRVAGRD